MGRGISFVGCFLLAVVFAASPSTAQAGPRVVFEDEDLDARTKDLLSKYAQQIRTWGMIQRVADAAVHGNSEAVPRARVTELEDRWQEDRADDLVRQILETECSQGLQTLLTANAGYTEAFVMSRDGRVVCMSRKAPRYAFDGIPGWDTALEQGDLWVSAAQPSDNPDLEIIRFVVPVLSTGEVVGGLAVGKLVPKV
jgi:hypothetical protein